jgi:PAS domain S-box-containing protein
VPTNRDFTIDRLKLALQLARSGLWQRDLRTNKIVRTPMVDEMFGFASGEVGDDAAPFLERIHPDDYPEMLKTLERAARTGSHYEMVIRIVRPDGVTRFISGRAEIVKDENGQPTHVISVLRDITDQHRAEDGLRQALNRSTEILESISDAFFALSADWRFTYANRRALEMWNRHAEDVVERRLLDVFPEATGSEVHRAYLSAMESRQTIHLDTISPVIHRWLNVTIYPAANGGLSVYFRDITERKRNEERQNLLLNELNHRVRNSLATVISLAQQTARSATSVEAFNTDFQARVMALAQAHGLLTRKNWEGASLRDVVDATLAPHRGDNGTHIRIEGPDCNLPASQALAMTLGLHELATNARKYGALSVATGTVNVNWHIAGDAGKRALILHWSETGGPPVEPPRRRGFGSRLLERALPSDLTGQVNLEFPTKGVRCTIEFPLTGAQPP